MTLSIVAESAVHVIGQFLIDRQASGLSKKPCFKDRLIPQLYHYSPSTISDSLLADDYVMLIYALSYLVEWLLRAKKL